MRSSAVSPPRLGKSVRLFSTWLLDAGHGAEFHNPIVPENAAAGGKMDKARANIHGKLTTQEVTFSRYKGRGY